ncbi:type I methionyl aminopeptidase [Treponema primitia]|uniref:type I methionyl aminopeptidase n=1 Tax=Treponema primitia TaxID=88058 RepID=UPI00397EEB92
MVCLKNEKQIDGIRKSSKMLSAMFRELIPQVNSGVRTIEIDHWVRDWIGRAGGKPVLLGYGSASNPFPAAICISINNEVIHGIPSKNKINEGDLVSLDCDIDLGGFISDQTVSIEVGKVNNAVHNLNIITNECLYKGIAAIKSGGRILQIAKAVYTHAQSNKYGVVREFCGHGVGLAVHEDPQVPNYPHGPNPRILNGMVIAVEPMISLGTGDIEILEDGWTVVTADNKVSAHWEHTVAIFHDRVEILTDSLEEIAGITNIHKIN